jgi:hypothetical protein
MQDLGEIKFNRSEDDGIVLGVFVMEGMEGRMGVGFWGVRGLVC